MPCFASISDYKFMSNLLSSLFPKVSFSFTALSIPLSICFPVYFLLHVLILISVIRNSFYCFGALRLFFYFSPLYPLRYSSCPWKQIKRTTYLNPLSKLDCFLIKKLYRSGKLLQCCCWKVKFWWKLWSKPLLLKFITYITGKLSRAKHFWPLLILIYFSAADWFICCNKLKFSVTAGMWV